MPTNYIATILSDLRNLSSKYNNYRPKSTIGLEIYETLKKHKKEYIFNITNFDPNLWDQVKQAIKIRSSRPAYLVYNNRERLELEQYLFLNKYIPTYPENKELFLNDLLRLLVKKKKGELNENKFTWE